MITRASDLCLYYDYSPAFSLFGLFATLGLPTCVPNPASKTFILRSTPVLSRAIESFTSPTIRNTFSLLESLPVSLSLIQSHSVSFSLLSATDCHLAASEEKRRSLLSGRVCVCGCECVCVCMCVCVCGRSREVGVENEC